MTNPQDAVTASATHSPSSGPHSSSPEEGRFPAGTVLAGRYRILGMLGKGGMGEVYKAFDLILNQNVALKFLTVAQYGDAAQVRFRNEVRIARQVSHPNVCRVYDLGFVEGQHFLSMEYIDGEDLASLLRRIGRLPQDKAIEFTRKICAGLSAAHDRGVLHRDLKPANIMIDGRGHVRITDFGLAALEAEIPLSDLRSGTPAYMSPEQKAGREVTARSDIYALGLILHEMFTGKMRRDTQSTPTELIKDLDPMIERLILRCLEDDPKRRPQSALAVAMALPGADPIAAALAAGETPSPEMVAASNEKEVLSPQTAVLCFACVVVALLLGVYLSERTSFLARVPVPLPPEALADRAQQFLKSVGYADVPGDVASGFFCCDHTNEEDVKQMEPARAAAVLASHQPPVMHFWYRQHLKSFGPGEGPFAQPTEMSPPNFEAGMVQVNLDATGRLLRLQVQPWKTDVASPDVNWPALFSAAGLDFKRFTSAPPEAIPPMAFDAQYAWHGSYSDDRAETVLVSGASWHGRPVLFDVHGNHGGPDATSPELGRQDIAFALLGLIMLFVAWRNWRSGRLDTRGAARLTAAVFVLSIVAGQDNRSFGAALFSWILYVGVEPYARRYWPDSLISWSRFSQGRMRNPLVASHILIAVAVSAVFSYLLFPAFWMISPYTVNAALDRGLTDLGSVRPFVASVTGGIVAALGYLTLLVLGRMLFRKRWAADLVAVLAFNAMSVATVFIGNLEQRLILVALLLIPSLTWIPLMRRFGFLTLLFVWALQLGIQNTPLTATGWLANRVIPIHLIPVALAAWALWVILSAERRPDLAT